MRVDEAASYACVSPEIDEIHGTSKCLRHYTTKSANSKRKITGAVPLLTPDRAQKSLGTVTDTPFVPSAVFTVVAIVVNWAAVIPVAHSRSTPSNPYLWRRQNPEVKRT